MRWLDGIFDSVVMNLSYSGDSEGQGSLTCLVHGSQRVRQDLMTEQQQIEWRTATRSLVKCASYSQRSQALSLLPHVSMTDKRFSANYCLDLLENTFTVLVRKHILYTFHLIQTEISKSQ